MKKILLNFKLWIRNIQYSLRKRKKTVFSKNYSLNEAISKFPSRNAVYDYMFHYFHNLAPDEIRAHREYFCQENRGFGEDAMHAMWQHIFRDYRPEKCLEIGVYRGQIISLWTLLGEINQYKPEVYGISPFTSSGDRVSNYSESIDYYDDTLLSFSKLQLSPPTLHIGLSTDAESIALISSIRWNLIYIDGNHDYEVALSDYLVAKESLATGGILVMDDSSVLTDYRPPYFAFAGHLGPSRVVAENAMKELKFIGAVGHNNIFQKLD
jgi:hypothetical protein